MKQALTVLVVLGLGVALGRLFEGALPRAEAGGGTPIPPCQDINGDALSDISDAVFFLQWRFLGGPAPSCPAQNGQPCGLPDTGQTKCYDQSGAEIACDSATCPGQDGSYATGCPSEGRFTDNGDGTVTDHCTGLMWQKDTADVNGDGGLTLLDRAQKCEALAYCENLSFAGHDDWRLPNVHELQSIVDYGRIGPAIDPVFGAVSITFWSSSPFATPSSFSIEAWAVEFSEGRVSYGSREMGSWVLAVRSVGLGVGLQEGGPPRAEAGGGNVLSPCQDINGDALSDISDAVFFLQWRFLGGPAPSCPAQNGQPCGLPDTGQTKCYDQSGAEIACDSATCPGQDGSYATGCPSEGRFTDNGDGTVTDHCTGLMWQKDTADVNGDAQSTLEDSVPWCDALDFCENLSFAGHDDWRLPNVRELQSIFDYGRYDPHIDPVFSAFRRLSWSATSLNGSDPGRDARFAWFVSFFDSGRVNWGDKQNKLYVRAVRSGP